MTSRCTCRVRRAILIMATAVMLFVTSCQTGDDSSVVTAPANATEDVPASGATAAPAGETGADSQEEPSGEAALVEHIDLTDVAAADSQSAKSVLALAASSTEVRDMAAGPWFSSTYSQSLAFDLTEPGRLVDQGLGWTTIEVGDPETTVHGLIRIVEALALSSPNGPIPISLIGPDSEFADTTLLRQGTAASLLGELSWRDVVLDGERVPQQFQKPCGSDRGEACVDGLITEGGPVLIEIDRTTRFVAQPFGSRRLYVVATALGPDTGAVLDQAFQLAASIITTERTEEATRRPLSTLGMRANALPAGSWFVEFDDVIVDLSLSEEVKGVSILDTGATWFAMQSTNEDGDQLILSVQVFQGFVDGALNGEGAPADLPLPADTYLRGIDAIVPIQTQGSAMIGGYPSRWYDVGDAAPDSPWTCADFERRDLDPDETCVVFSIDGWRIIDRVDRPYEYRGHYVEELGVLVVYPGVPGVDSFVIEPKFQLLLEGLTLTTR